MKSRFLTLVLLAAALAVVGASCGGGDEETAGGETSAATSPGPASEPDACAKENLELVNEGPVTIVLEL